MLKKLTLLALSVAALVAFAVPAAAQAEGPLITNSLGEAAESVTATSENTVSTTGVGTLECTTVNLDIGLSANSNTTAEGSGTGTAAGNPKVPSHTGPCFSSSGLGVDIIGITVDRIHLDSSTTGSADFSYTYQLTQGTTVVAHCTFDGEATVTKTGESSLNIEGALTRVAPSTELCPASGSIKGDFDVFDEFGSPAVIH